jgi:hypothetical protein
MFTRPVASRFEGRIAIRNLAAEGWSFGFGIGSATPGMGWGTIGRPARTAPSPSGTYRDPNGQLELLVLRATRGSADQRRLDKAIGRSARSLFRCWDEQRPYSERLTHPLVVDVLVADERLADARVAHPLEPNVDACVLRVLRRHYFQLFPDTIARLSFRFSPTHSAAPGIRSPRPSRTVP